MKIDKLSGILGGVVYPMFMLPAMGFLLVQVYQINARSAGDHISIIANSEGIIANRMSITRLEAEYFSKRPEKEEPKVKVPIEAIPLDRRKLRVEK